MSKTLHIGVNNVARKVSKMYVGVNGVARKVKKAYIGVNGVARCFYSSRLGYTAFYKTIDTVPCRLTSGTIGDYAIFYNDTATSTAFTAVSNSLTTTSVTGESLYNAIAKTNQVHNGLLMGTVRSTSDSSKCYLRGISPSLTTQVFTSLQLTSSAGRFVEFNNNLFILTGYYDRDDDYCNSSIYIDSSLTQHSYRPPATVNTHPFSGRSVSYDFENCIAVVASPNYMHAMFNNWFLDIYSVNTSLTAYINSYRTSTSDPNGLASSPLHAYFDNKALFGLGRNRVISGSYSTYHLCIVTIDDNLTENYKNWPFSSLAYPPGYAFNTIFDNVLWVGSADPTSGNKQILLKIKPGLVTEMDNTYIDTYINSSGVTSTYGLTMCTATPTSINDPSFLVCSMYNSNNGWLPAMVYQR